MKITVLLYSLYYCSIIAGSLMSMHWIFFFLIMVYSFQDNVSHDSDLYNILSMVSLVGLVVCLSITFLLKIYF